MRLFSCLLIRRLFTVLRAVQTGHAMSVVSVALAIHGGHVFVHNLSVTSILTELVLEYAAHVTLYTNAVAVGFFAHANLCTTTIVATYMKASASKAELKLFCQRMLSDLDQD